MTQQQKKEKIKKAVEAVNVFYDRSFLDFLGFEGREHHEISMEELILQTVEIAHKNGIATGWFPKECEDFDENGNIKEH